MLKSIIYLIFTIEIYNFPCVVPMGCPPTLSHNTHTHMYCSLQNVELENCVLSHHIIVWYR